MLHQHEEPEAILLTTALVLAFASSSIATELTGRRRWEHTGPFARRSVPSPNAKCRRVQKCLLFGVDRTYRRQALTGANGTQSGYGGTAYSITSSAETM